LPGAAEPAWPTGKWMSVQEKNSLNRAELMTSYRPNTPGASAAAAAAAKMTEFVADGLLFSHLVVRSEYATLTVRLRIYLCVRRITQKVLDGYQIFRIDRV